MSSPSQARRWALAEPVSEASAIGDVLGIPVALAQALYNRGLGSPVAAQAFLSPAGGLLHDPALLPDIIPAIERLRQAAHRGEAVGVFGDYDVDGVTGCALLTEVLQRVGCRVLPYIPDRASEGYGMNLDALRELVAQGATLILTVDCGSSDVKEIAAAQDNGLDVIVIDHHQVPEVAPQPLALVNPRRVDSEYPFGGLAAVGVAYKVAQALLAAAGGGVGAYGPAPLPDLPELLDLVALGTVADVAPLLDENRALVKQGLAALNRTSRLGLQRLCTHANIRPGNIDARAVGYILGPRLNAAGRLRHARTSYRLLLTADPMEAEELAEELDVTNRERQEMLQAAVQVAREEILAREAMPSLLLLCGEEYQSGIVGLVASRLVEEFYRPAIVIERGAEESRGSARSIAEFHITQALTTCQDMLTRFGGHAQAAGFSLSNQQLTAFAAAIQEEAQRALGDMELAPTLKIDAELDLADLDFPFYEIQAKMAPFGHGNPTPLFLSRGLVVREARAVGSNLPNHLRMRLSHGRKNWSAIAFGKGEDAARLRAGDRIDVVFSVVSNDWNGLLSLELQVADWRPSNL